MPIKLGTNTINAIKLGTNAVSKVCVGSQQIWGGSPQPVQYLPFYVENNDSVDATMDVAVDSPWGGQVFMYYSSTPLYAPEGGSIDTEDFDGEIDCGDGQSSETGKLVIPANSRYYIYIDPTSLFGYQQLADDEQRTLIFLDNEVTIGGSAMSLICGDFFTGYEDEFEEDSQYNFRNTFYGNTSINIANDFILPAKTMTPYCYEGMFEGVQVNRMNVSATSWNASYATDWLDSASATGTFTKPTNTTIPTGASGIPSGWTVVNK